VLKSGVRPSQDVNARERVRRALKDRLAEIGMTGRAFGKAFSANDGKGHVDTWVSGLLKGQFGLSLDELDEAAHIVKLTPASLVKSDYEHAEYLTPTEHRIVQAMRALPASIRDHFLMLAEYLIGVAPDEIDVLEEYRELAEEERTRVRHWMHVTRIAREPAPGLAILPDLPERAGRPTAAEHRTRGQQRRRNRR
jgi:hypothetical protein